MDLSFGQQCSEKATLFASAEEGKRRGWKGRRRICKRARVRQALDLQTGGVRNAEIVRRQICKVARVLGGGVERWIGGWFRVALGAPNRGLSAVPV